MLKQRVLTAVPLAALAIWLIFFESTDVLFYALLLASLVAGWEWARLAGLGQMAAKAVYALAIVASIVLLDQLVTRYAPAFRVIMIVSVLWWMYVLYRMSTRAPSAPGDRRSIFKMLIGFVTLAPAVLALKYVHGLEQGPYWLFYIVSIIWVADIGAYFSGKRFGKIKLAPLVSPGKTREGLYGGLVATTLYTMLAAIFFELNFIQIAMLVIIAFFATLLSVIGDLFISVLKRERGVKDSGSILPGHGGILDRIDSITSSAPFFVIFLELLVFHV